MKGQLGEWLPRHPQWQHWGDEWLIHEDASDSTSRFMGCVEGADDVEWLEVHKTAAEVDVVVEHIVFGIRVKVY